MLEEDAELGVGVRVDGDLEHGEEDVLQHFAEVGHEVPASEDVARRGGGDGTKGLFVRQDKYVFAGITVDTQLRRWRASTY